MADGELFGLDDALPDWARDDSNDIPELNPADGEPPAPGEDSAELPERAPGRAAADLPAGVTLLSEGAARFYTQRTTAPPMVDCMFAALCTPLSYMGYGLPNSFVGTLREASGVPRVNAHGKPQGTTTAHSRIALRKLLPEAPILFGGMTDEEMLERLGSGDITVRVTVAAGKLPGHLRRFVGRKWEGGHAVALGGARRAGGGTWEVFWMDPAGRPAKGYDGEFVPYNDVKSALRRTPSGGVRVTVGQKNAALPGQVVASEIEENGVKLLTHAQVNEFAPVQRGTPFLHPETGERVTEAGEDAEFRLAGRSIDGKFAGVWVNTSRVPKASGLTLLLVDVSRIGTPFVRP